MYGVPIPNCPSCGKFKNVSGHRDEHRCRFWKCGDCQENWMEEREVLRKTVAVQKSELQSTKEALALAVEIVRDISEHESGCIGAYEGREQQCRCIVRDACEALKKLQEMGLNDA